MQIKYDMNALDFMIREHVVCLFFKRDFCAWSREDVTFFKIRNTITMFRHIYNTFGESTSII